MKNFQVHLVIKVQERDGGNSCKVEQVQLQNEELDRRDRLLKATEEHSVDQLPQEQVQREMDHPPMSASQLDVVVWKWQEQDRLWVLLVIH